MRLVYVGVVFMDELQREPAGTPGRQGLCPRPLSFS
jgi:hypothetical protein